MELAQSCEEVLTNYLKGLVNPDQSSVWSSSLQRGAGQNFELRIFPGESDEEKNGQCILCIAERDFPEHIPSSAIYEVPIRVVLRTPTKVLTSAEKQANPPVTEPLVNHQTAAAALRTAMMAVGLELLLTAAQQDFTVFGMLERQPTREQDNPYWESGISAKLVCCGASFQS